MEPEPALPERPAFRHRRKVSLFALGGAALVAGGLFAFQAFELARVQAVARSALSSFVPPSGDDAIHVSGRLLFGAFHMMDIRHPYFFFAVESLVVGVAAGGATLLVVALLGRRASNRRLAVLTTLPCLLVCGAWFGCNARSSRVDGSGPSASSPNPVSGPDRGTLGDHPVSLVEVAGPSTAPADGPGAVWDDLWKGIQTDLISRDLFSRLYGGLPVEFVDALTPDPGLSKDPRPYRTAVVLQISAKRVVDSGGGRLGGTFDLERTSPPRPGPKEIKVPEGQTLSGALSQVIADAASRQHDDRRIIDFTANDYLLRKHPGWRLVFGFDPADLAAAFPDRAARRAELDRAIDEYLRSRFDPQSR